MSGGQRQAVAIARGAYWGKRIVLLDEPTAALGVGNLPKCSGSWGIFTSSASRRCS